MRKTFYKYRDLKNFSHFEKILLENKLHAGIYSDFNDENEGQYTYYEDTRSQYIIDKIKSEKNKLRICSLSRKRDDILLWGYYANGSRGVNLVLEIVDKEIIEITDIKYQGLYDHQSIAHDEEIISLTKKILSRKLPNWKHESETRVFTRKEHVDVKIKEIILGSRISENNENNIRELVKNRNPKIKITKGSL